MPARVGQGGEELLGGGCRSSAGPRRPRPGAGSPPPGRAGDGRVDVSPRRSCGRHRRHRRIARVHARAATGGTARPAGELLAERGDAALDLRGDGRESASRSSIQNCAAAGRSADGTPWSVRRTGSVPRASSPGRRSAGWNSWRQARLADPRLAHDERRPGPVPPPARAKASCRTASSRSRPTNGVSPRSASTSSRVRAARAATTSHAGTGSAFPLSASSPEGSRLEVAADEALGRLGDRRPARAPPPAAAARPRWWCRPPPCSPCAGRCRCCRPRPGPC